MMRNMSLKILNNGDIAAEANFHMLLRLFAVVETYPAVQVQTQDSQTIFQVQNMQKNCLCRRQTYLFLGFDLNHGQTAVRSNSNRDDDVDDIW